MPHLSACKAAVMTIQSATLLALHQDRLDDALDLLETQLRIARNFPANGIMVEEVVRIAIGGIAWNSTWELLQAKGWTEAQLLRLQNAWQDLDFAMGMLRAIEIERAVVIQEFARCRASPSRLARITGGASSRTGPGSNPDTVAGIITEWSRACLPAPGGAVARQLWAWFWSWDDERMTLESTTRMIAQTSQRLELARSPRALPLRLPTGQAFLPAVETPPGAALERYALAAGSVGYLNPCVTKAFSAQTLRELALAAVAIRRYQGREGALPQTLAALTPDLLPDIPLDWFDGQALRYRLLEPGRFLLYSVSQNRVDDGGDPKTAPSGSRSFSPYLARDFVWPEAADTGREQH
jgi:hypothetical protein